ncbi:MAG: ABC transporter permease [Colwellia sp.]|nr:ABC transporter permease [Colwellia sp.]
MTFWIDIKYAARLLLKNPVFTATSVLIVAIGLGLTLYTYSLLNQLIFKPLTLNGGTPIIAIEGQFRSNAGVGTGADAYHLNQISAETELLHSMSLYITGTTLIGGLDIGAANKKFNASFSQWNIFEVAGVQPILGRGFNPQDHDPGAEKVVVISNDVWQNHFSGNKDIIGATTRVDTVPTRIIGVMPDGFAFPAVAQIWVPLSAERVSPTQLNDDFEYRLLAVARLKQDVSLPQFQQELKVILQRNLLDLPQEMAWRASSPGGYIRAFPFKLNNDAITVHYSMFIAMMIVVMLILLLTCINIGNLLLARVNERIKEVAIRIALGIPRKRLVLQMLWESIFICCLGGFLAFFFAKWGVHITNSVFDQIFAINGEKPFWWQISLDMNAIMVLLVAIVLMILVTGFIPAWRALSGDLNGVLRDGTRGALGKKAGRANKILVIAEIALSCVVLMVATILLSTSYSAQRADYGVNTQNRITATVRLPSGTYPWNDGAPEARKKINSFWYQLKDELEQQPNIHGVAFFNLLPGTGNGTVHCEIEGKAAELYNENPSCNHGIVTRDAWSAVGMKMIAGREFDLRDMVSEGENIIINESMAKHYFPNGDALGQRIRHASANFNRDWQTIIGIVSDSIHGSVMQTTSAQYTAYLLMDWDPWFRLVTAVHYSGPQSLAESTFLEAINNIDADVTAYHIQSYDNLIKQPMMLVNAINTIFLWCGLIALFLAASGIYAVAANSITLRKQEIATRRALGSRNNQVIKLFLKQAGMQLLFGLALGISLSLWLISQITQSMIIDSNSYLIGLIGIPIFIIMMVLIATYLPASKVIKKEPSEGLREG